MSLTNKNIQSKKIGYFDGLQQPCTEFSFSVTVPTSINFEEIDQWLLKTFETRVTEHSPLDEESHDPNAEKLAKVVWRVMHL